MQIPLSIIIPTRNEEYYLPKLLHSIKEQTVQPAEIIIADADSTDKTREIAKKFRCKIVQGGNHPGIGRNKGAAVAKSPLLLFLDADVIMPDSEFLSQTTKEFAQKGLGVAGCLALVESDKLLYRIGLALTNFYFASTETFIKNGAGYCLFILREVHEKIGGFDETIMIAEDHDYVKRASKFVKYRFLRSKKMIISLRRYELEGKVRLFFRYIYFYLYMFFNGKITRDTFPESSYSFSHNYVKKKRR